ncbi:hypothetical protein [Streptomyces sp. NPDC059455]|uniref:hypothetical protein n=1 Tax=Streptomyces sp. NPDC059455 TaxID=3346837 RepID=UPI0036B091F6
MHRPLSPRRRRHVLATDAARSAATRQCAALAEPLEWQPRWATGQQTSPALYTSVAGDESSMNAVACTTIDGRPMAVVGGHDEEVRVWDLATGEVRATLGHALVVEVVCGVLDGTPVAVTAGYDMTVRVFDLRTADGGVRRWRTCLPSAVHGAWARNRHRHRAGRRGARPAATGGALTLVGLLSVLPSTFAT